MVNFSKFLWHRLIHESGTGCYLVVHQLVFDPFVIMNATYLAVPNTCNYTW